MIRHRFEGKLTAFSAIHVGGVGGDAESDHALARDGLGRYVLPGTSLAGPMRQWIATHFGADTRDRLFGFTRPGREEGLPSRLIIDDAPIEGTSIAVVRDGVGIDRRTGAARARIKHDRAVLAAGSRFAFRATLESDRDDDDIAIVVAVLRALERCDIKIGAATTRGLGRVGLADLKLKRAECSKRDGLLAFLESGWSKDADIDCPSAEATVSVAGTIRVVAEWRPVGPLVVKAGWEGKGVDAVPLTEPQVTDESHHLRLILPGASIKGALRSGCEQIVRTVLSGASDCAVPTDFAEQLAVPLVEPLFGNAPNASDAGARKGAVSVSDCLGIAEIDPEKWGEVMHAESPQDLGTALTKARLGTWKQAHQIAIDRWLGSVADGRLFSVLEPRGATWGPMTLEIDATRLGDDVMPALALLVIAIERLATGWITLGSGASRGNGQVEITGTTIEGWPGASAPTDLSKLRGNPDLGAAWRDWIDANRCIERGDAG